MKTIILFAAIVTLSAGQATAGTKVLRFYCTPAATTAADIPAVVVETLKLIIPDSKEKPVARWVITKAGLIAGAVQGSGSAVPAAGGTARHPLPEPASAA